MIQRTHRFHGRKSLGLVYRHGQILRGPHMALKYIANQRTAEYRVAVVVSRKVSKSAVVRNRIRRRIYESVRSLEGSIKGSYDLVFLVREAELAKIRAKELHKAVESLLAKADVLPGMDNSAPDEKHDILVAKETKK
jgi:ribonuclease P protein component